MSLSPSKLIAVSAASYTTANDAALTVYCGAIAGILALTHWHTAPCTLSEAANAVDGFMLDNGIPLTDWQTYKGDAKKIAVKIVEHMPLSPEVLAVRDADDELEAVMAMRDLLTIKGVTCRAYLTGWAGQEGAGVYDVNAKNNARKAKERAKLQALLNRPSNLDAASEAVLAKVTADVIHGPADPLANILAALTTVNDAALINRLMVAMTNHAISLQAVGTAALADLPSANVPASSPAAKRNPRSKRQERADMALAS